MGLERPSPVVLFRPSMDPSRILLNDFPRQWQDTGGAVLDATRRVGESGWYILGREVAAFETALGISVNAPHVIGCASGLDAIEIGLRILGLRSGDRVLTTPLSAFATSLAIVRAGGVPVFVDVDEAGLVDLDKVEAACAADPSLRFFVPVHLYGHCLDLQRLQALRERFNLRIVEDGAQAIGARSRGLAMGSVGQVATTSFYPTKNLGALGDGGALWTTDSALDKHARSLRDYGQSTKYVHDQIGLNSRLDELHAAILRDAFLPKLAQWTARRVAIAGRYRNGIANRDVQVVPLPLGSESVWHLFPVMVPAAARDQFKAHLAAAGVASAVHYPLLISAQKALESLPCQTLGILARAEAFAEREVSLPIHPYLDDGEVERVIAAVNSWIP